MVSFFVNRFLVFLYSIVHSRYKLLLGSINMLNDTYAPSIFFTSYSLFLSLLDQNKVYYNIFHNWKRLFISYL